ncbi:TPA: YopX family protein [Streptococcus agalactiae]|uniref:YopX family protein n=1 Tax=Streptococcus sp. HMSC076D11 TaxID=1715202 RepID=UPI0008A37D0B|nr:YopX family protein [Streptococcus sp. HMSC076D11]HEN9377537.1 hypothetical protein [Streptococcus agalactiae]OFN81132.1 hypothetical protein HMPREF2723_01565 [Streptococcus sp. HMSC076D11]HEO0511944.1 hypothetical protein [Streptococcus agalactiae]HEO1904312.1 hypothetical protein [Streptococcus agalactiae]HEO1991136.1 hypothetical protein [Streptococcus agalactiae]
MIPKFRVWDKVTQAMGVVEAIDYVDNKIYTFYRKVVRRYIPFEEAVLMQSTGLKDKNGIEIWEGDMVLTTRLIDYTYKNFKGVVKMLEGRWVIDTGTDAVYLWSEIEENEVIGNVYQNSDLIESVEE